MKLFGIQKKNQEKANTNKEKNNFADNYRFLSVWSEESSYIYIYSDLYI